MNAPRRIRIRIRYTKQGKVRFISHRDLARVMERALRKLRLPVAYSEGFSPRPRLSFGLALSVGHESDAEYLDVDVAEPIETEGLAATLSAVLPPGLTVTAVHPLAAGEMSLQEAISASAWLIEVLGVPFDDVEVAVARLLATSHLEFRRERKGKQTDADVRPAILELEVLGPTDRGDLDPGVQLRAVLAASGVTLRPAELVSLLGDSATEGRVRRTHQWTMTDGERQEPIALPAPAVPHEFVRAS